MRTGLRLRDQRPAALAGEFFGKASAPEAVAVKSGLANGLAQPERKHKPTTEHGTVLVLCQRSSGVIL